MKKTLRVLGAIFLVLVVAGIVSGIILAKEGVSLDAESHNYVDSSVTAIVSNWDKNELLTRASSGFLVNMPPSDVDRLFAKLRTLGRLKKYTGSQGQARISFNQTGKTIVANYVASAEFDTAPAQISLTLVKNLGEWKIHWFYVSSKAFL